MSTIKNSLTHEQIKAKFKIICICKGIKQGRVCEVIAKGAKTLGEVNVACGSGSGGCFGRRCGPVITQILDNGGLPLTQENLHGVDEEQEKEIY